MALGSLTVVVTDLRGRPLAGTLRFAFTPHTSARGGAPMEAAFDLDGHDAFTVSGIECLDGLGTLYVVRITARGYRPYAFFQMIAAGKNRASEARIGLMANPRRVNGIDAPPFAELPAAFRRSLGDATMVQLSAEDADLVGKSGAELYDALGPLRQACLLNLVAKAMHPSAERIARYVIAPTVLRQDRSFARVDPAMADVLRRSNRYKSAPSLLHTPPRGFERLDSFKTRDAHANLQVTFMRESSSGVTWADIDIDEASGVEHGFEVIRNAVVDGRTNPFVVRDLLLLAAPDAPIDPGYDLRVG